MHFLTQIVPKEESVRSSSRHLLIRLAASLAMLAAVAAVDLSNAFAQQRTTAAMAKLGFRRLAYRLSDGAGKWPLQGGGP